MARRFDSIDEYLAACTPAGRAAIEQIREVAHRVAPDGTETISYQMPGIRCRGKLVVSFAAWKDHVAVYPAPSGDAELADALAPYRTEKATLRFRLGDDLPLDLIERVIVELARAQTA